MFKRFFVLALFWSLCLCAQAKNPSVRPSPKHHKAENQQADKDGLSRIKDQEQLDRFVAQGLLVPLPEDESIEIDKHVPANRRYCRPWTRVFLLDIGRNYKTRYHKKIKVTSGVRTLTDQEAFRKHNANASPTSTHPTGATVDVSWKHMHKQQVAWMVVQLLALERAGKVQATMEHHQACFHVLVLKKYSEGTRRPPAKKGPAKKTVPKKGGRK